MAGLATLAALLGALAIGAGSPIGAVVYLIGVFVYTVGYLAVAGLGYVALVYLIVYIGAIAILFLFVVMMLELRAAQRTRTWPILSLPVLALALRYTPLSSFPPLSSASLNWVDRVAPLPTASAQVEGVGELLLGPLAPFLPVVGLVLTLGMVGPVQLCAGLTTQGR